MLRAVASRSVPLLPATAEDLAAAVVGADAWMLVTGVRALDQSASASASAVAALGRVCARAAGQPAPAAQLDGLGRRCGVPQDWVEAVDIWEMWVASQGLDPAEVFTRAAHDLAVGDGDVAEIAAVFADVSS